MKPIIEVKGLSKKYRLGEIQPYFTLRDTLADIFKNPLGAVKAQLPLEKDEFWALKDINFEVNQGEVVGIIGRNGSGKSTLLKILSQITPPTEGEAILRGRVGSLLEVGTGFSPELTGRENIYLNGAVLGMKKIEVKKKFDEIVAFSEVEKFLDTPLKHYSSGMYMRLAFAVAAHLEPEILIVDEVLAVGDAEFQKKCLGKMGEVAGQGRTVLFVSHNMGAVRSICNKAILLGDGIVVRKGKVEPVTSFYLDQSEAKINRFWNNPETAPGNDSVRIKSAQLLIDSGEPSERLQVDSSFSLEFEVWNYLDNASLNFSLVISNTDGIIVFNSTSDSNSYSAGIIKGSCKVPANLLNDERYRAMIMITRDRSVPIFFQDDILIFDVKDVYRGSGWQGKWPGLVRPQLQWNTSFTSTAS